MAILQKLFPHERHIFAYDGCVRSVERGLSLHKGIIASELDLSVEEFAKENSQYYSAEFDKIQGTTGFPWSWNTMAAVFGPLWGAVRPARGAAPKAVEKFKISH